MGDLRADDHPEVEPFVRTVEEVCGRFYPGPEGRKRAAYVLLGVAVRLLSPSYGKARAQEEIIDFMTHMRAKQTS